MRIRERQELTPDAKRLLDALDAALAGEPLPSDLADVGDLAIALREDRPRISAEFVDELDEQVRRRFGLRSGEVEGAARPATPAVGRGGGGLTAAIARRLPSPGLPVGLAAAAAVFIVAVAAVSSGLLSSDRSHESGDVRSEVETTRGLPADRSAPSAAVPSPSSSALRAEKRKVERSAALTLSTPGDRIEDVADGVVAVTDRHGGFVVRSSVSSGDSEPSGATLDLRIPSNRLVSAIAELSKLAHVSSRSQNTLDITGRFVSPRRRLAEATAERRGLLRQLANAVTPNQTASIRARLRLVNARIDRATTELRGLQNRVSFAAVAVSVEPGGAGKDGGRWTPGDAAGDAVGVLGTVFGAILVGLAALVPLALVVTAVLVTRRTYLRRSRERALDAS